MFLIQLNKDVKWDRKEFQKKKLNSIMFHASVLFFLYFFILVWLNW